MVTAPFTSHASADPSGCPLRINFGAGDTRWGNSCFEPIEDDQWVEDVQPSNGWNVRVQSETNYGKIRWCAPTDYEVSGWHGCGYDHREDSCVRFRGYEQQSGGTATRRWTNWTDWLSVSHGGYCYTAAKTGSTTDLEEASGSDSDLDVNRR